MKTNTGVTLRRASKTKAMQMSNATSHRQQLIPINAKLPPACLQGDSAPVFWISPTPGSTLRPLHPEALVHFTSGLFFPLSKHLISHNHYSKLITLVTDCSYSRTAFFLSQLTFNEVRTCSEPSQLSRYSDQTNDRQIGFFFWTEKFLYSNPLRPTMGPIQPPTNKYWRVKWPKREAVHSHSLVLIRRMSRSILPLPPTSSRNGA